MKEFDGKQWIALDADSVLVRPAPRSEAEADAPWALVDPALEPGMTPVAVAALPGLGRAFTLVGELGLDDVVALLQCSPAEVMEKLRSIRGACAPEAGRPRCRLSPHLFPIP